MSLEQSPTHFSDFKFENTHAPVAFISTGQVVEGVHCDVYQFVDDPTKDLGIIQVQRGHRTPLQRVVEGERTIEGYLSGKGKFTIISCDGQMNVYECSDESGPFECEVPIGGLMQWEADADSELIAYEICIPPYEEGRFENIN